jgi:O-antigen/teichoic acid export membrane protein
VSSFIAARLLGVADYGVFGIVQSTLALFQLFAGFALGVTATKYVAQFRTTDQSRAERIIALTVLASLVTGLLCSIILFAFAPYLATHALNNAQTAPLLRISSIALLLTAIHGAQTGILSGLESFKSIAKVNLTAGLFSFPAMVAGAWWGGVAGCVWALVVTAAVNCASSQLALRRAMRSFGLQLSPQGVLRELPVLRDFTIPAVFEGSLVLPVIWICNIALVNSPHGYVQMGIYNAANQWFTAIVFLPQLVGQVLLPVISERVGSGDSASSAKLMTLSVRANSVVVIPFIAISSLASPLIMKAYGPAYAGSWPVLIVVLITAGIVAVIFPISQVIAAAGKMWLRFLMNMLWAGVALGFVFPLVQWGALGLSLSRLFAYGIHGVSHLIFAWVFLRRINANSVPRAVAATT